MNEEKGKGNDLAALNDSIVKLALSIENLHKKVDSLERIIINDEVPAAIESKSTARFYSFHQNSVAGGIALPLAFALTHPLDTIKTRMQVAAAGTGHGTFSSHLKAVFKKPGLGFLPSVLGACPQGGLRLGCYGFAQHTLHPFFDSPVLQNAIAAVCGDFCSSFVKVPREIIVQRLQTGLYKNTFEACKHMYKTEGLAGFFTGYWSTSIRDFPFMIVLFVSYEQFKLFKVRFTTVETRRTFAHEPDREWSDMETILWGGLSGSLAGFTTTPMDVIKTRIMTETTGDFEKRRIGNVVSQILKEEGVRGLFSGAGPRSGWWFAVCSVFFYSFERIRLVVAQ